MAPAGSLVPEPFLRTYLNRSNDPSGRQSLSKLSCSSRLLYERYQRHRMQQVSSMGFSAMRLSGDLA